MVEGGGLENRRRSRVRGFESLPLRQPFWAGVALLLICAGAVRADEPRHAWVEPRLARALEDPVAADTEMRLQGAKLPGVARSGELRVVVEPPAGRGSDALPFAALRALGARVDAQSRSFARISASPAVLRRVAALDGIRELRFPLRPIPVEGAGSVVSESVALTGASALQPLGINGSGVKVAVLDVGFIFLAGAQATGNIPTSAITVNFSDPNGTVETTTAHGTAVAEQVVDMAPGAQLYVLMFADEIDFENAVTYVRDNGIRIANLSVNWFGASYYDDTGPINDIINHSHDVDGVFWAVGGGNWAYRHWRGPWLDEDGDGWLSFAPNDERLGTVAEQAEVCWVLNWNQYPGHYAGTITDLDLFVYSNTNALVATSQNRQVAGAQPAEQACFPHVVSEEPYTIGVHRFSGPTAGLEMTLVSADSSVAPAEAVFTSSLVDPADAHGAFAVGAVDKDQWPLPGPVLEGFSSQGPTTDGRLKPELVAPDRTASAAYGASALGTSFASPVVAGAAALLAQQAPGISANQIRAALVASAHDIYTVGRDNFFGYGELVAAPLVLPLDSDGDSLPDTADPCPFAASNACTCGDVDGSGGVSALDELVLRTFLTNPAGPNPGMVRPELCNVLGAAAPFPLDCRVDDWVVMRRARAGRAPGIQPVCSAALPP